MRSRCCFTPYLTSQTQRMALTRLVTLSFLASAALSLRQDTPTGVPTGAPTQKPIAQLAPEGQIAPFGKEDTARELQSHAARTQDTLVDAVENAEVAEIKRAVFRALTRLRAAQIKEFDTIARL